MFAAKIVFSAAVMFTISDTVNADHMGLWEAPSCESVWNPASPPKSASQAVIGTVQFLDSVGYFSGGNGAVLGGTTPYNAYVQIGIASNLGALDPSTQTAEQQQCMGTFEIAQSLDSSSNAFGPVVESDMAEGTWVHGYFDSFAEYVLSLEFFERRLCPCYNMMPRELFENLNCKPTADATTSLSASYIHCQSIDFTPYFAAGGPYDKPLAMEMDMNRDTTKIEGWQGCIRPDEFPLAYEEGLGRSGPTRNAAHSLAVSTFNLKASVPPADSTESPVDWLDRTAGSCMPCTSDVEEKAIFDVYSPANPSLTRAYIHEGCAHDIFLADGTCEGCEPTKWSTPKQGCCRSDSKRSENPPLKLVTSFEEFPTLAERNVAADMECKHQCADVYHYGGLECMGYEITKLRRTKQERRKKQPAMRYGCELHFEPLQKVGARSRSRSCRRATCSAKVVGTDMSSSSGGLLEVLTMICSAELSACTSNEECGAFLREAVGERNQVGERGRDEPPTAEEAAAVGKEAIAVLACYMAIE